MLVGKAKDHRRRCGRRMSMHNGGWSPRVAAGDMESGSEGRFSNGLFQQEDRDMATTPLGTMHPHCRVEDGAKGGRGGRSGAPAQGVGRRMAAQWCRSEPDRSHTCVAEGPVAQRTMQ